MTSTCDLLTLNFCSTSKSTAELLTTQHVFAVQY